MFGAAYVAWYVTIIIIPFLCMGILHVTVTRQLCVSIESQTFNDMKKGIRDVEFSSYFKERQRDGGGDGRETLKMWICQFGC